MKVSLEEIVNAYEKQPLEKAATPPASWYIDPRVHGLERQTVFARSWQVVGRTEQLREPGQYVTATIAGEPILVVRGNDQVLRGFYNVCRHHAAAVLTATEGKAANLRCPYHGWTYSLEGMLILAPEFGGVADFDRSANSLLSVPVAVYRNWIFVKLERGAPELEDFFGNDLIEQLKTANLLDLHWFERRSYMLNCNWKVFVDNYLDGGYHVPHIHGDLHSVLDYSSYTVKTGERFCLQSSAMEPLAGEPTTAAVRQGRRADYYWIYPNFMINLYEGVMDTNLVIPHAADQTEVVFDYFFDDVSGSARERNLTSIAVSEQIQAEDAAVCESVQRGLQSRGYSTGRLSVRREAGEHLFHRLLHIDLTTGLQSQPALR
jgi:choline monooxygenase